MMSQWRGPKGPAGRKGKHRGLKPHCAAWSIVLIVFALCSGRRQSEDLQKSFAVCSGSLSSNARRLSGNDLTALRRCCTRDRICSNYQVALRGKRADIEASSADVGVAWKLTQGAVDELKRKVENIDSDMFVEWARAATKLDLDAALLEYRRAAVGLNLDGALVRACGMIGGARRYALLLAIRELPPKAVLSIVVRAVYTLAFKTSGGILVRSKRLRRLLYLVFGNIKANPAKLAPQEQDLILVAIILDEAAKLADVTGDGTFDGADLGVLANTALEKMAKLSDVNLDGSFNVDDITALMSRAMDAATMTIDANRDVKFGNINVAAMAKAAVAEATTLAKGIDAGALQQAARGVLGSDAVKGLATS